MKKHFSMLSRFQVGLMVLYLNFVWFGLQQLFKSRHFPCKS